MSEINNTINAEKMLPIVVMKFNKRQVQYWSRYCQLEASTTWKDLQVFKV